MTADSEYERGFQDAAMLLNGKRLPLAGDVEQERLYATTDAQVWAEEFAKVCPDVDRGLMLSWFANAIETAKRIALEEHPERKPVHDCDFVVLGRDALFQFFGEVALPPWHDADGRWIGGEIDCAPIASRITAWVAEHDLGDLYRQVGAS